MQALWIHDQSAHLSSLQPTRSIEQKQTSRRCSADIRFANHAIALLVVVLFCPVGVMIQFKEKEYI
jgi:hypothetical protein